jgi:hypothetical protein
VYVTKPLRISNENVSLFSNDESVFVEMLNDPVPAAAVPRSTTNEPIPLNGKGGVIEVEIVGEPTVDIDQELFELSDVTVGP